MTIVEVTARVLVALKDSVPRTADEAEHRVKTLLGGFQNIEVAEVSSFPVIRVGDGLVEDFPHHCPLPQADGDAGQPLGELTDVSTPIGQ